jgi:hypothetical protein
MRQVLILTAAVAALGVAGSVHAQPAPAPAVNVSIGPALQQKADDFGPTEIDYLAGQLRKEVQRAVAHAPAGPVRVDLVIEDAKPNRPTSAQLGRSIGLSLRSIGVGGARVSGVATYADGSQRPIREQFYETSLRDDRGADTWYDASRAFDQVAYDLRSGRLPAKFNGPGPSGSGHFGYPYTQ